MEKLCGRMILNREGYHVAETVLQNDRQTSCHSHDFYEVFLMQEGRMIHYLGEEKELVVKEDLCLVRPEDSHCFRKENGRTAHFINLAFSEEIYEMANTFWKREMGGDPERRKRHVHLTGTISQAISARILYLIKHMQNAGELPAKNVLFTVLLDCFTCLQNEKTSQEIIPGWLENACRKMQKKENYQLGLKQFVEISGKSQEHLTRMMKKYYHLSPSAYINRIRLEHAAYLLRTTEESVLDIMLESGFNNASYFHQRFREEYGQSPAHYRQFNQLPIF